MGEDMRSHAKGGSGVATDVLIIILALGLLAGLAASAWYLVTAFRQDTAQAGSEQDERDLRARALDLDKGVKERVSSPATEATPANVSSLQPSATFEIPRYRGKVPSIFDDITWLEREEKLMLANSIGVGEFPLKNGEPVFVRPGFTAECPGCDMRGFVQTKEVPTTALVWAKRVLSVSVARRKAVDYSLPDEITDPSGLSHDGKHYLVSDREANVVFRLTLNEEKEHAEVVSKIECGGSGVEAVAVQKGALWTTDGNTLWSYDDQGGRFLRHTLPARASGIVFAEGYLWATAKGKPIIYRFAIPGTE